MKGSEFKKLRERVGTQREVAAILGVHPQTIAKWETEAATIPPARDEDIRRLASDPAAARGRLPLEARGITVDLTSTTSSGEITVQKGGATHRVKIADPSAPLRIRFVGSGDVVIETSSTGRRKK